LWPKRYCVGVRRAAFSVLLFACARPDGGNRADVSPVRDEGRASPMRDEGRASPMRDEGRAGPMRDEGRAGRAATASPNANPTAPPTKNPRRDEGRAGAPAWLKRVRETPDGTIASRFPTPKDRTRVEVAPGSFGAFLRDLPLLAPGSPVRSFKGDLIRAGDHPRVAGVVALDLGPFDLQQCADTIVRLHAEWQFARGNHDLSYRASSGFVMDLAHWEHGARLRADGNNLQWIQEAKPDQSWESFRAYLDRVFTFTNTVALARDAATVKSQELEPGDFFVQAGFPGHAVIVLDLAVDANGKRYALLGQGFMPAQNLHVLKTERDETWFPLDAFADVYTPFWQPFHWSDARRLPQ
jgi:hypothetical protein